MNFTVEDDTLVYYRASLPDGFDVQFSNTSNRSDLRMRFRLTTETGEALHWSIALRKLHATGNPHIVAYEEMTRAMLALCEYPERFQSSSSSP